jgi:hypothetical protein
MEYETFDAKHIFTIYRTCCASAEALSEFHPVSVFSPFEKFMCEILFPPPPRANRQHFIPKWKCKRAGEK